MANRQTYVAGALGVLVGMVIGVNSAHRAEMVAFSGHNPNAVVDLDLGQPHKDAGYWRQPREEEAARKAVFAHPVYRMTPPRRSDIRTNVARRTQQRINSRKSAAPSWNLRGYPQQRRYSRVSACRGLSGQRYTHCLEAYINGENYEPNYFSY